MQMWVLKPPGFHSPLPKGREQGEGEKNAGAKKWPLVYLVHGGPQGANGSNYSGEATHTAKNCFRPPTSRPYMETA